MITESDIFAIAEKTLYEALRNVAEKHPERAALEFMGRITSYRVLLRNVDITAMLFYDKEIRSGDRVAVCAPNCPQSVTSIYALNKIGAAAVMLNPLLPPGQLLNQIRDSHCKGLVILDIFLPRLYKELRRAAAARSETRRSEAAYHSEALRSESALEGSVNPDFIMCLSLAAEMNAMYAFKYRMMAAPRLISAKIRILLKSSSVKPSSHSKDYPFLNSLSQANETMYCSFDPVYPNAPVYPFESVRPDEDAIVIFSGGTSGNPKPVVHSSAALNLAAMQCLSTEPPIEDGMSMLAVLPIFHIFGFVVSMHLALVAEGKCILVPRFRLEDVAKLLIEKHPTYMAGVPSVYTSILKSKRLARAAKKGKLDFGRFRIGFCGGDKIDPSVLKSFNNLIESNHGNGRIVDGYGLTESCPVTVMPRDGSGPDGSIGIAFPGIKLCIAEPSAEFCADESAAAGQGSVGSGAVNILLPGEEGEICISAQSMMSRYLNSPEETRKALRMHSDGLLWLHTGDIGVLDQDGYLFLKYRLRRIIKISGYSVYPKDVERILLSYPSVKQAVVMEKKDEKGQFRILAFIVLDKEKSAKKNTQRRILDYCRQNLAPWAVPSSIVIRKSLPVNLLGKTAYGRMQSEAEAVSSTPSRR